MMHNKLISIFILSLLVLGSMAAKTVVEPKRTHLLRLKVGEKDQSELRAMKIKFATGVIDSLAMVVVTKTERALLKERGYTFDDVMHSDTEIDLYKRALYGKSMRIDPVYHTYEEILDELAELKKRYPSLLNMKKIGVSSQEQRDIHAVKISDNASREEDEPAILFSGSIHGDEIAGTEICMTLINHLLSHYKEDDAVRSWVNDYEIWFIPVINVEGHYVVTHNIDPRWRKNLRDNNGNGVLYEPEDGIDLNRNFDFNWAHGGSSDSNSVRYRGEYPFSESECAAVRDLVIDQKFVLSVTYHSQGEVIFYPWSWRDRKAPDDALLTRIAEGLAGSIRTMKGDTTYQAYYGAGTVGQTYPWMYGAQGTFDFIVETGKGRHVFPKEAVLNIVESNLQGAFYMLDQMKGPGLTGHVRDADTGQPLVAEVWFPDIDTEDVEKRTSDPTHGRYYRLLKPGMYRVMFMKEGYARKVMKNVKVDEDGWHTLDMTLKKNK